MGEMRTYATADDLMKLFDDRIGIPDHMRSQFHAVAEAMIEFSDSAMLIERAACASLIENMRMSEILLSAGEMTADEKRVVRAVQGLFAHRIRSRNATEAET